jgi:hypothetical protein
MDAIPIRILFAFTALLLSCSTFSNTGPSAEPAYRYDNLTDKNGTDAAIAAYQAISQWDQLEIAYYFINDTNKLNGDSERELVRQAFDLWAEQTPLSFTEVNNRADADIVIGWASGEHGDGDPFDGPGDVLAHASFPNPFDDRTVFLHFDDDERWVNSNSQNVDLLTVAAHEIGHTLGLGHSTDPEALMFPSYRGPHRFLGTDDIAGAQSLYGAESAQQPGPSAPEGPQESPPPSASQDSDRDGISDRDEVLVTGTDPAREDSDSDGLGDGVEVVNRMNPLDADMDRDGVSDGQEVADGTDPFFPEQADVSPELEQEVSDFLTEAIELQIDAYQRGDASIASAIMTGDIFNSLADEINTLNAQGLVNISQIDYYESYIADIRVISSTQIEVDTCEVWATATYRRTDGALVKSDGPGLLPQTITIQRLQAGWFITSVNFFDAPSFCN